METAGFGGVDQGLSARRLDDYKQYNIAVQGDVGRLVPEKVKLSAPVYYSKSNETITPKYNPLDQDMLLKDALDAATTKRRKGFNQKLCSNSSFRRKLLSQQFPLRRAQQESDAVGSRQLSGIVLFQQAEEHGSEY